MSYYGRAESDASYPRAHAICDRCGRRTNHYKLRWQFDWRGPRMQNLRFLVCESCYDAPQQSGQRTILIPPDPVPIMNARPEFYVQDSNPLSNLGASPNPFRPQDGSQIGNLTDGGGIMSAFNGSANKPDFMCAMKATPKSSYNNYVGINWSGMPATITPSSLNSPVLTHTVTSFSLFSPNNTTFGSTAYLIQGSPVDSSLFGAWTTIASGNTSNVIAERIDGNTTGGRYQFHRVAFLAPVSGGAVAIAQVEFNVSDGSSQGGNQ